MSLYQLMSKVVSLETELSEIKQELKQQEVKTKRWKPDEGKIYFYIDSVGDTGGSYWTNDETDKMRFRIGNVFETSEEAKFQVEKLKVVAELKEYTSEYVKNESNYFIYWSHNFEETRFNCWDISQQHQLYFKSKEIAQQAVDVVGEERVKKYYLEVVE